MTDINPGTGQSYIGDDMNNPLLIGDTIVFTANDGSTGNPDLWAYNTSNHTTWKLTDVLGGFNMMFSIGDTIYYDNAYGHTLNGKELMAYNMVNNTAWNVVDIDVGGNGGDGVGKNMWHLIGDVLYFDADDGSTGRELWAYDFTNETAWQVHDGAGYVVGTVYDSNGGNPGQKFSVFLDETIYFSLINSTGGPTDLWAHDTSNGSTWRVEGFYAISGGNYGLHQVVSVAGDTIYLSFHDGNTGYELWAYDTSNYSTWQVTDINNNTGNAYPGGSTDSSASTNVHSILVGDTIYFRATITPYPYTYEMWAHDTSNQSTWRVTYINSSATSTAANTMLVLVNDTIILDMIDGPNSNYGYDNGHELWAIQPAEITSLPPLPSMTDVNGATCSISPALPTGLNIDTSTCTISGTPSVATSNTTYNITADISGTTFQATVWLSSSYLELTPSVEGADLIIGEAMEDITFQYDSSAASGSGSGSNSGTYNGNGTAWMVENIANAATSSFPDRLTAVGNTLFFKATNGQNGFELWKSNGTSSGTVMVKDINSGSLGQATSNPNHLTEMGGTLYFSAMDTSNNGHQLWKSDGTASGTVMVTAINSGGTANPGIHTDGFVVMNNNLYFSADDGPNGVELWKSDGTASGTVMVKDITSGSAGSFSYTPAVKPVVMNNELYFNANDGNNGYELWKSDGTASGTVMVKDINIGGSDSFPQHLTVVGNTLYFDANDGTNGNELWKSDGTASGTVMVKDIAPIGTSASSPQYLTGIGNTLYFQATDGTNGIELWKSDGTASGTVMVQDINSGGSGSSPKYLTVVDNTLYFQATDGTNGNELWKSDGTASGTVMVQDIHSSAASSYPQHLTAFGNTLYFQADDGYGTELWKSDGTASGTVMVQNIGSGSGGSLPRYLTAVGNTLYFSATDGTNGYELWALDPANITGLSSGSGSGSSSSSSFAYANDKVSAGAHHTCAILDNGDLKCWGFDNWGQLGDGGSNTDTNAPSSTAIDLGTGRTAVALSAGAHHTCAILDNGDLKCWGRDDYGQLGDGGSSTDTNAPSSTAIDLGTGRTAVSVAAGYQHTCVILDNGDAKCWGQNSNGQLGSGFFDGPRHEHLHPQRLTLARAERPLRCMLEITTPAPCLTTAT